jgi:hypothetical protein
MHSEHDLDLIADLVEGRLDDPAPAEALIATCTECAEAYEAHRLVEAAVAAEPAVSLNDFERRRLHDALWADLAPALAQPEPRKATAPWWYRVAPVAAALVVVVGVGTVLTGGSDQATDTFETVGAELDADGSTEEGAEMFAAPEETVAADQADTLASRLAPDEMSLTRDELEEAAGEFSDRITAGPADLDGEVLRCVEQDGMDEGVVGSEPATVDGDPVWFVAFGSPDEVTVVKVYRQADCTVVFPDR